MIDLEYAFGNHLLFKKYKNINECHIEIFANTAFEVWTLVTLLDTKLPSLVFNKLSIISFDLKKSDGIYNLIEYLKKSKPLLTRVIIMIDNPLPCLVRCAAAYNILLIDRKISLAQIINSIRFGIISPDNDSKLGLLKHHEFITLKTYLKNGTFCAAKRYLNCSTKNLYRYRHQALKKLGVVSLNSLLVQERWLRKTIIQDNHFFVKFLTFPNIKNGKF